MFSKFATSVINRRDMLVAILPNARPARHAPYSATAWMTSHSRTLIDATLLAKKNSILFFILSYVAASGTREAQAMLSLWRQLSNANRKIVESKWTAQPNYPQYQIKIGVDAAENGRWKDRKTSTL